jgi:hypothetical protein
MHKVYLAKEANACEGKEVSTKNRKGEEKYLIIVVIKSNKAKTKLMLEV